MSKEGILNIASKDGSKLKGTMYLDRTRAKEHGIWLSCLLSHPGFLERCSFKQNTQGRVKATYILRNLPDWQSRVADVKLTVASFLTKAENSGGN